MKTFNIKTKLIACASILLVCSVYASCVTNSKTQPKPTEEEQQMKMLPYRILSDTLNTIHTTNQGRVRFVIDMDYFDDKESIPMLKTSVNGVWKDKTVDSDLGFEYLVEPGNYKFQFYANDERVEITIPKIAVEAQHDVTIRLSFYTTLKNKKAQPIHLLEKPVIYVYSDEEVPLEIGVKPKGALAFTYPQTIGKWNGTATKNGFDIDGKHYPYLFWEAKMDISKDLRWGNASFISKDQVLTYLEEVCDKVGLNDTERTDLITYWGPRMMQYENIQVLALTEGIDQLFGELSVSNDSFKMERFYLIFKEANGKIEHWNLDGLKSFKRSPKFILEWGGADVTVITEGDRAESRLSF